MTDDDEVTVPGDHEVIAEFRRRTASPAETHEDDFDDDVTLEAEPAVIAEIRAAAADAAAPKPTPLPPPRLRTLPPPQGAPVAPVSAATEPSSARWQPTGRLPVAQRIETRPTSGPRPRRTRWFIGLAVVGIALVTAAIFSLRDDGDDEPAPATTEVVTTTSP